MAYVNVHKAMARLRKVRKLIEAAKRGAKFTDLVELTSSLEEAEKKDWLKLAKAAGLNEPSEETCTWAIALLWEEAESKIRNLKNA